MSTAPERNDLSDLLPSLPSVEPRVVQCTNSNIGILFFSAFSGARLTGLSILRFAENDIIALTTEDRRAMVIVAEKAAFIAVELHGQDAIQRSSLAFRGDISHSRLNLGLSLATGENVTYLDPETVQGEILPVDPTAEFSQLLFNQEAIVRSTRPSRYTEDWVTVSLADGRSIVIRADRGGLQGAIAVKPSGLDYMNIGDNRVDTLKLDNPSQAFVPSKFLPNSAGE